ncbi:MAG: PTS sugar transporter subunit IIC [Lachnospiraceae bacterium]|nr:PTS sugar transporter subunit IIC [Lachnospiraceae bacterium]
MKKLLTHIFIDGVNGMAIGFFCTFAFGTILQQLGCLLPKDLGDIFTTLGAIAIVLTGAGMAGGMVAKFQSPITVALSAIISGMVGAYSDAIFQSSVISSEGFVKLSGSGDLLSAFIAAFVAIGVGALVSGKTDIDILLTPILCTGLGCAAGLLISSITSNIMEKLAWLLEHSAAYNPILMSILVSILMCLFSVLPVSCTSLILLTGLKGAAAGAATIGCCCSTVGFAIASYHDNKHAGLFAQGLGTAKLQLANIFRRPYIILPPLLSSTVLAPLAVCVFHITNTPYGASMGTTGLVGCLRAYDSMVSSIGSTESLLIISLMCFILPGICSLGIAEIMRKLKILKDGDMKIG